MFNIGLKNILLNRWVFILTMAQAMINIRFHALMLLDLQESNQPFSEKDVARLVVKKNLKNAIVSAFCEPIGEGFSPVLR